MVEVFKRCIHTDFSEIAAVYTAINGRENLHHLIDHITRRHGIIYDRRTRESRGEARARGLIFDHKRDGPNAGEELEEGLDPTTPQSADWWRDTISGLPSTLPETVTEALQSGFTLEDSPVLRSKVLSVAKTEINFRWTPPKFHIPILESCSARIIPGTDTIFLLLFEDTHFACTDPTGTLGEDEIFVRSSHPFQYTKNGVSFCSDVVAGDVLVSTDAFFFFFLHLGTIWFTGDSKSLHGSERRAEG
jgi:hypothetical protein